MNGFTYDAGALIAAERRNPIMLALHQSSFLGSRRPKRDRFTPPGDKNPGQRLLNFFQKSIIL